MIGMNVTTQGIEERVLAKLSKAPKTLTQELQKVLAKAALSTHRKVVNASKNPGRGRVYEWQVDLDAPSDQILFFVRFPNGRKLPVVKRNKPHRASAEGDSPARDTGSLVARTTWYSNPARLQSGAGTTALYGPFLEHGTKYMGPRPIFGPVVEEEEESLQDELDRILKKVF